LLEIQKLAYFLERSIEKLELFEDRLVDLALERLATFD
jgi:hypothetical protein